jgi:broad specificity phosphatase PhoE
MVLRSVVRESITAMAGWMLLIAGPLHAPSPDLVHHPARIFIIRHAEKPMDDRDPGLSKAGRRRASQLPRLFDAGRLPKPQFIFAARNSKQSHRSVETARPVAEALDLPLDTTFRNEAFMDLAKELSRERYDGKTILIVWHQGTIPALARALGATHAPKNWRVAVFDRVWEISYGHNHKVTFRDRPQGL